MPALQLTTTVMGGVAASSCGSTSPGSPDRVYAPHTQPAHTADSADRVTVVVGVVVAVILTIVLLVYFLA